MDNQLISAYSWNRLCRQGALGGYPAQVLDACEKAVRAAPVEQRWKCQDSRGLARALTANSQGAIEDFEFVINTGGDQYKKQRQAWAQALRYGRVRIHLPKRNSLRCRINNCSGLKLLRYKDT